MKNVTTAAEVITRGQVMVHGKPMSVEEIEKAISWTTAAGNQAANQGACIIPDPEPIPTIRDNFAMAAFTGIVMRGDDLRTSWALIAEAAYQAADAAMIMRASAPPSFSAASARSLTSTAPVTGAENASGPGPSQPLCGACDMSEQPKAHEWSEVGNAVATAALEAFKARAPEVVRKAAEDLYETILYDAQDYLVDNVTFNIAARIGSAERQARLDRERASELTACNLSLSTTADRLRAELSNARTTIAITRTQIMVELSRGVDRWEGVPDALKLRLDAIDVVLAKDLGEGQ